MLGGHADATFGFTGPFVPHIMARKLRALAITDVKRHRDLPDVPTAKEEGYDVVFTMWRAVLAPKGTPPAILDKLEGAFKKLSQDKSFQALIKSLGDDVNFQGGKEFAKTWREEWEQHGKIVAGAK